MNGLRRRKVVFAVMLCILTASLLVLAFVPETAALLSHLRHGFSAECCGVQIEAPLHYAVKEDPRSILLLDLPGYVRKRLKYPVFGQIFLSISETSYDTQQREQAQRKILLYRASHGFDLVRTQEILVAGHPLECSELYAGDLDHKGPASEILCVGKDNGFSALFDGRPTLVEEFYSVLRSAKPAVH